MPKKYKWLPDNDWVTGQRLMFCEDNVTAARKKTEQAFFARSEST